MLRIAVYACLLALCAAQPARPNIPETFSADFQAEVHREQTLFGKGHMARDESTGMGVENTTLEIPGDVYETMYRLERYDKGKDYTVRGRSDDPNRHCAEQDALGKTLPPFWAWLSEATYMGSREVEHRTFDFWGKDIGGVHFEVGMDLNVTNVPGIYIIHESRMTTYLTFSTFTASEPPATDFTIPTECPQDLAFRKKW